MAGGCYKYIYKKILDFAESIDDADVYEHRKRFVELLERVSEASEAIELVDSGIASEVRVIEAVDECFAYVRDHLDTSQIYPHLE